MKKFSFFVTIKKNSNQMIIYLRRKLENIFEK